MNNNRTRTGRRRGPTLSRALQWMGLLGIALALLLPSSESTARVQPYQVVRNFAAAGAKPKILFAFDSSGSMARDGGGNRCDWDQCEDATDTTQSRLSAARRVVHNIVEANRDVAKFALATFEQNLSPSASGPVPGTCTGGDRFTWITQYCQSGCENAERSSGGVGVWKLCRGAAAQPWPYLRWDELGHNVTMTNNAAGDPPASPILADADLSNSTNATRRVQWFSRFNGVRFNLDCSDPDDQQAADDSIGDYASTAADRTAQVCGHDYYYWPYVDGFPGYARHSILEDGESKWRGGPTELGVIGVDSSPGQRGCTLRSTWS